MKINIQLESALTRAGFIAVQYSNEYILPEHLLFSISETQDGQGILTGCNVPVDQLQQLLIRYFQTECPTVSAGTPPEYSGGLQDVIAIGAQHSVSSEQAELKVAHILVAMFRLPDSDAVYLLGQFGLDRLRLVRHLSHESTASAASNPSTTAENSPPGPKDDPALTRLSDYAKTGTFDPLIGRSIELNTLIETLSRRKKNNPVLVGDAGVGKTAIVEGLATAIHLGQVPAPIQTLEIFSLNVGLLLSGTRYRGDFEERLNGILTQIKTHPHAALFIDEIHLIVGAGATSGSTTDVSNLIKPELANGTIRCIGTSTHKEYLHAIEKDPALSRRFFKIDVEPPSVDESIEIIKGIAPRYETFHGVEIPADLIRLAVTLSDQHIKDRALPDKAIDALDHAAAVTKIQNRSRVTDADIRSVISRAARVPSLPNATAQPISLQTVADQLKSVIIGQDAAIGEITRKIMVSKTGLGDPNKPIGSFLFVGPTGVGKTELSKQLAKILDIPFIRFDMSEYMEKHTVSRLIGSPPGYVGHDDGGQLTDAIRKSPHAVLLLDEIEKAHPDIMNVLLQVMDYATLTDSLGRKLHFNNVILIMTSNSGARAMQRKPIGFDRNPDTHPTAEIKRDFSPEFRNRLSATICFNPLSIDLLIPIATQILTELRSRLTTKGIDLSWTPLVPKWIAEESFDPLMGARPMRRFFEFQVTEAIATDLISGTLQATAPIHLLIQNNQLVRTNPS